MKFTIAGDSHGSAIFGILEGIPAGFSLSTDFVDRQLARRQSGYGRGKRMQIEQDRARVVAGLWNGQTTGAPLVVEIANRASNAERQERSVPRPGHVDFAAWTRYGLQDLTAYAERSSARYTASLTSIGAIAAEMLSEIGIVINGSVIAIGRAFCKFPTEENWLRERDDSPVFCHDREASKLMVREIESAIEAGDTLGGQFVVIGEGIPPGIGGYGDLFERLDSRIGKFFMTIPSVKGVIIGNPDVSLSGREYHDAFSLSESKIVRDSNNAGGVEGGISNGQPIVVTAIVKPIPTLRNGINSVDLKSFSQTISPYVRSDVTAVPAASVVGESVMALLVLEALLERFGTGNFRSFKGRVEDASILDWNDGLGEKHNR